MTRLGILTYTWSCIIVLRAHVWFGGRRLHLVLIGPSWLLLSKVRIEEVQVEVERIPVSAIEPPLLRAFVTKNSDPALELCKRLS